MQDLVRYAAPLVECRMSIVLPVSAKSHFTKAVLMESGKSRKLTRICTGDVFENESRFCGVAMLQLPPCSTVGEGVGVAVVPGVALAVAVGLGVAVAEEVAAGVLVPTARPEAGACAWLNCFSCRHPASRNENANASTIAMRLSTSLN